MSEVLRVRAPASTANIGPAFDCAGAAIDLWNELEVSAGSGVVVTGEGEGEIRTDADHLGLRAFAALVPIDGRRFVFHNRIPLARGLGSSAATIALGLAAAAALSVNHPSPNELLAIALEFEDHPDNLAPALLGGACLAWHGGGACSARRIADDLPLSPVLVIPPARVSTVEARSGLPAEIPFDDAAYSAGRAAMLGAAIARGDASLFTRALDDRIHEPYRASLSAPFGKLRAQLPAGAKGVTISGSGPTVIVWTEADGVGACVQELEGRFPDAQVIAAHVSAVGAGVFS